MQIANSNDAKYLRELQECCFFLEGSNRNYIFKIKGVVFYIIITAAVVLIGYVGGMP